MEQHLYNGCPTSRYPAADGRYRVRNEAGQFLGLANIVGGVLREAKTLSTGSISASSAGMPCSFAAKISSSVWASASV